MNLIRSTKVDDLIQLCFLKKNQSRNKIEEIYSKIESRKKKLLEEERFFCRDQAEDESNSKTNSIFYNSIKKQDILYNLKSFFPIEERFLDMLEVKMKKNKELSIDLYRNNKTDLRKDKKNLDHCDMICYVCNNPDYHEKN